MNALFCSMQMDDAVLPQKADCDTAVATESATTDNDALDALLLLAGCNENQVDRTIQVNTECFVQKAKLLDLLITDTAVQAFTGIASMSDLHVISREVAAIDDMPTEITVLDRVVLVLIRLKTCLSFTCLATLFGISKTSVHRCFYHTVRSLATVLEAAIPWPSKEEIARNLPICFDEYREVRVVLDCTEVQVEKCHCSSCRILTYSHYKGCHTAKVLIGVSPGGLITFVSNSFGGRSSDKACVDKSGVLNKLASFQDDVMVDKGFNIDAQCESLGLGIVQPPFLRQKAQFTADDATRTIKIARARVHVERAIQRMKIFKVLKGLVPWETVGVLDDIFIVIAGIVNLSAPILSQQRFGASTLP